MNDSSEQVRVRFAPSPTGYLHIGGARTALYNWLWARKNNGVFVLRIEDTDVERSTEDAVEHILEGLRWLGLEWDEGPNFQSKYVDLHIEAAWRLFESGHAYRCFCTKEELEEQRKQAETNKVAFMYNGRCRELSPEEIDRNLKNNMPFVLRFRVPRGSGESAAFEDAVFGRVDKRCDDVEDFVILRSDGSPLYILSNAVDDANDRITHVIRGADGLANTPKQVLIYKALGIEPPLFAHMPLTLDSKKAKLSKRRHGEVVTVSFYRKNGFIPWALCNFMALLGWSTSDDREFFTREELIEEFDLSRINRANSVFSYVPGDPKNWTDPKAIHFNATYIRTMPLEDLFPYVKQELVDAGLWRGEYEGDLKGWFLQAVDLMRARFLTLKDFSSKGRCYFADDFEFDEKAVNKNLRKDDRLRELLPMLADRLEALPNFNASVIEKATREFCEERDVKPGLVINAARTAVSGQSVGPSLFELLEIVGRERVAARLRNATDLVVGT